LALLYVRKTGGAGGADVLVPDLGIIIPSGTGWTLLSSSDPDEALGSLGSFSSRDIRDSQDLFDLITGGQLDWSTDGSITEPSANYKADYMIVQDLVDDTLVSPLNPPSLTISGVDATAHFDGSPNKHDASEINVEGTYTNIPSAPTDLETVISEINTSLSASAAEAFKFIQGNSGIATADVPGDTLNIIGSNGVVTTVSDDPEVVDIDGNALLPRDGSRGMTGTLDMAGNSIASGLNIDATGNVDFGSAQQLKLPQAADVSATFPGGSEGDIAWDIDDETLYVHDGTQWFGVAPASGIVTDHGGLTGLTDDDHPQYANLGGSRTRNTISGVFDYRTTGDVLLPTETAGQTTLADGNAVVEGAAAVINGFLAAYDGTRAKWLSVERQVYTASKKNKAKDIYLQGPNRVSHLAAGIRIPADSTITSMAIKVQNNVANNVDIIIRKNDTLTALATVTIAAGSSGATDDALNVDVNAGDEIQIYVSGNCRNPHLQLHIARRF